MAKDDKPPVERANDDLRIRATPELLEFVRTAGPDTATGRARAFGIDVDALVIKLATTTAPQRLAALDQHLEDMRALRSGLR